MSDGRFISTTEAARIMGISRIAVFKKIKKGEIQAEKVGRAYIVDRESLPSIYREPTPAEKKKVIEAVRKVVKEYSKALQRLGKE